MPENLGLQLNKIGTKSKKKKINLVVRMFDEDPYRVTDSLMAKLFFEEIVKGARIIAKAINDKLMGFTPAEGSVLGVVYENVEKLSETRELESVSELDESVYININLVNRPITESEVQL